MFEKEAFITLYIYILLFPKIYYFHRAACNQHFSLAYPVISYFSVDGITWVYGKLNE